MVRLAKRDYDILTSVAEHRILTFRQITLLHAGNQRSLQRRLNAFEKSSLVQAETMPFPKRKGRPENIYSLSSQGVNLLKSRGIISSKLPTDKVMAIGNQSIQHLLLTNDFRTQLVQLQCLKSELGVAFLSPSSPFIQRWRDNYPVVSERFCLHEGSQTWIRYTPDGVFSITHKDLGKALLFYLEVDMATEALASEHNRGASITEKIVNYQLTYKLGRYKRYEKLFKCGLQGFRLLLLTCSVPRMNRLCKLVRQMPPSDFVHVTDQESMLTQGLWAPIWYRGGRQDLPPVSILGDQISSTIPPIQ